jgi:hypothetical protein
MLYNEIKLLYQMHPTRQLMQNKKHQKLQLFLQGVGKSRVILFIGRVVVVLKKSNELMLKPSFN